MHEHFVISSMVTDHRLGEGSRGSQLGNLIPPTRDNLAIRVFKTFRQVINIPP